MQSAKSCNIRHSAMQIGQTHAAEKGAWQRRMKSLLGKGAIHMGGSKSLRPAKQKCLFMKLLPGKDKICLGESKSLGLVKQKCQFTKQTM